jgi:hypothetical protein
MINIQSINNSNNNLIEKQAFWNCLSTCLQVFNYMQGKGAEKKALLAKINF